MSANLIDGNVCIDNKLAHFINILILIYLNIMFIKSVETLLQIIDRINTLAPWKKCDGGEFGWACMCPCLSVGV